MWLLTSDLVFDLVFIFLHNNITESLKSSSRLLLAWVAWMKDGFSIPQVFGYEKMRKSKMQLQHQSPSSVR